MLRLVSLSWYQMTCLAVHVTSTCFTAGICTSRTSHERKRGRDRTWELPEREWTQHKDGGEPYRARRWPWGSADGQNTGSGRGDERWVRWSSRVACEWDTETQTYEVACVNLFMIQKWVGLWYCVGVSDTGDFGCIINMMWTRVNVNRWLMAHLIYEW